MDERSRPADRSLKVFISYRRSDTEGYAGHLYEALRRPIGTPNLFMDVDSMKPGQDFVAAIRSAVAACNVVLVLIGPAWASTTDEDGARRIDDPLDFVTLEVAAALTDEKVVIPLLLGGARMPKAASLPEPLRPLTTRHAVSIRHDRFRADVAELVKELRRLQRATMPPATGPAERAATPPESIDASPVGGPPAAVPPVVPTPAIPPADPAPVPSPSERGSPRPAWLLGAAGVGAVALVLAAGFALSRGTVQSSPSPAASPIPSTAVASPSAPSASPSPSVAPTPGPTATPSTGAASPVPSGSGEPEFRYLSPDGTLALTNPSEPSGFEIYLERADGSGRFSLSNHPATDLFPTWAPDSAHVLFVSARDFNDELYLVDIDGTNLRRLTDTPGDESWPAFSADGELIAYVVSTYDGTYQGDIWLMNADGSDARALIAGPEDDSMPSWTPDGRIRFTRFGDAGNNHEFVVRVDGTGLTQIG